MTTPAQRIEHFLAEMVHVNTTGLVAAIATPSGPIKLSVEDIRALIEENKAASAMIDECRGLVRDYRGVYTTGLWANLEAIVGHPPR